MDEIWFIKDKIKEKFDGNLIFYVPFIQVFPENKEEFKSLIKNPIDLTQISVSLL